MSALGSFPAGLKCRNIEESDREGVISCLCRGFPDRGKVYWMQALDRLSARPSIGDLPQYGYVLETDDGIVGVLLTIHSRHGADGDEIRCNLSSLCVDDAYRSYGAKLVTRALRRRTITHTNISPAPATRRAAEALGFRRFANGQFAFVPRFSAARRCDRIAVFHEPEAAAMLPAHERDLLGEHAKLGCLSLVCTIDGRPVPFILKSRHIWGRTIPCHQVVYCRSTDDLARCAGLIGRFLSRRGAMLCLVDAVAPIPGLRGHFFRGRGPKYFKGPQPPRPGDLTFTEMVFFED